MKFVFKLLALVFASAIALQGISSVSGDCDAYSKNKAKCLLSSENNEPCSFCTSAAVGTLCAVESATKDLPPSVFSCEYQSKVADNATGLSFNETLMSGTSYSSSAAVNYGNQYCASHSEWLCAEFVSRALNAGGLFSGVSDYGNYKGYNLRLVSDLHKALKTLYGWTQSSSGTWCGSSGQVLIYNGDEHAALAIGNCLLDQHNPSHCGTNSAWGSNIVLKAP